MKNKAFTLIELLIAILIIGILAAIAVQQYKKAVIKSKAAHMQTLLDNVVKASDRYYLQNGEYPKTFEDLDIEINLPSGRRTCLVDLGDASIKQSGDFAIAIHSGSDAWSWKANVIAAYFITGKYKCRGFSHVQQWRDKLYPDVTYCMEALYQLDCGEDCENGIFCKDIMGKKYKKAMTDGLTRVYD